MISIGQVLPVKAVAKKKAAPVKAVKNGKAAAKQESESDDDDDEDSEEEAPPKKAAPAKATPAKKAAPAEESSDDEEDDDESEEEPPPPPKKATPAKAAAAKKAAPVKKAAPAEESDEDDDESEEEEAPPPKKAAKPAAKAPAAKAPAAEDESDEEDDDVCYKFSGFSLFLGNLNSNKDFDESKSAITKFFSKEGLEIQDVRLGGSKKFGYVDFASEEELQKALGLNGKKLMGLPVKLDKARSKENSLENKKERDSRTLFVKNLPYSITQEELQEVFDQATDIRIPMGSNGSSRGIAYLEFKSEAIAEKTMEEAQGSDVQGRSIIVDFTGEKSRQGGRAAGSTSKVLVVNNLSFSATEEALQSVFEKAVSIRIPQNNGRPKGYVRCFINAIRDV
ncbi:nucleolin-like [Sinocyclocheilus grahami]|uniref:nucleolin-like n=1 Tax=Sinocyclocheilus grahami TaxID=75366 RepID=UPI0007AD680F|nr:PREDICTED: nucleolin-like [Sinocyclocheilus grahami]